MLYRIAALMDDGEIVMAGLYATKARAEEIASDLTIREPGLCCAWPEIVGLSLIRRLIGPLWDKTEELAMFKGQRTDCAARFSEWAYDIGPLTFLHNTDGEVSDTELQLFGKVIFHGGGWCYGGYIYLLGLRLDWEHG